MNMYDQYKAEKEHLLTKLRCVSCTMISHFKNQVRLSSAYESIFEQPTDLAFEWLMPLWSLLACWTDTNRRLLYRFLWECCKRVEYLAPPEFHAVLQAYHDDFLAAPKAIISMTCSSIGSLDRPRDFLYKRDCALDCWRVTNTFDKPGADEAAAAIIQLVQYWMAVPGYSLSARKKALEAVHEYWKAGTNEIKASEKVHAEQRAQLKLLASYGNPFADGMRWWGPGDLETETSDR